MNRARHLCFVLVAVFLLLVAPAHALNVLLADQGTSGAIDVQTRLTGLGHSLTASDPNTWDASFDYSPYDVVAFQYNSGDPADIPNVVAAVDADEVGVVFFRGYLSENTAIALGMITGARLWWQTPTDLNVLDNTHPITTGLPLGVQNLGYTYMTLVEAPDAANTTTLAGGPAGAALVVHDTRNVVITPFYGHPDGYDLETPTGLEITERSLYWAAKDSPVAVETSSWGEIKALYR